MYAIRPVKSGLTITNYPEFTSDRDGYLIIITGASSDNYTLAVHHVFHTQGEALRAISALNGGPVDSEKFSSQFFWD